MRETKWTCDWCKTGVVQGHTALPSGWIEREGKLPYMHRDFEANEKKFMVHTTKATFCTDKCNQSHKTAQESCDEAARAAWISEYHKHAMG